MANEREPVDRLKKGEEKQIQFHFCAPFNFQGGARCPMGTNCL